MKAERDLRCSSPALRNSLLVLAATAGVIGFLITDGYLANATVKNHGYRLAYWVSLAATSGTALWISWYLSTRRLLALLACGGGIGALTQWVGTGAGLWTYSHEWTFAVFHWALGAVALYGVTFVLDLVLHKLRLNSETLPPWWSCACVLVLFTALIVLTKGPYAAATFRCPWFWVYYGVLFGIALTCGFHIRLGRMLSIIIAAWLGGALAEHTGGILDGLGASSVLWDYSAPASHPGNSWLYFLFGEKSPPLFLVLAAWPLETIAVYSLSGLIADRFAGKLPIRDLQHVFYRLLRQTPELSEAWVVGTGIVLSAFLVWEGYAERVLWTAALLALAIPLCAWIAARMSWVRVVGVVLLGGGAGLASAAAASFAGVWAYSDAARAGFSRSTFFFTAPLWAVGMILVYGLAYLIDRLFWEIERKPQEARGEPSVALRNTTIAIVLYLVIAAITHWRLTTDDELSWGFIAVTYVLFGCFCLFLVLAPKLLTVRYVLSAALAAAIVSCVVTMAQLFDGLPVFDGHVFRHDRAVPHWLFKLLREANQGFIVFAVLLALLGTALAFLFTYCASAYFAEEPLTKIYRARLRRRGHFVKPYERGVANPCYRPTVAVCHGSCYPTVRYAVRAAIEQAMPDLLERVTGKTVFIKPNLMVQAFSPYCVDAEVLREVTEQCLKAGAKKVQIGETSISDTTAYQAIVTTGLQDYLEIRFDEQGNPKKRSDIEVLPLDEGYFRRVTLDDKTRTAVVKEMLMPEAFLDADVFINIAQLKSHVICEATLGIKNYLGLIPDFEKRIRHDKGLPKTEAEANVEPDSAKSDGGVHQKLVDLAKVRLPDLTIITGWEALEGDGPWMGDRVDLHVVIASTDLVAADSVAGRIMGYENPLAEPAEGQHSCDVRVETTYRAHSQGLGRAMCPGDDPGLDCKVAAVVADLQCRRGRPFQQRVLNDDRFYETPESWGPMRIERGFEEDSGCTTYVVLLLSFLQPTVERLFPAELDRLRDWVWVCGPLNADHKVLGEGALLFGDRAIASERFVYARRLFHMPGNPPNQFVEGFERIGAEMGLELVSFLAQAMKETKGEYL